MLHRGLYEGLPYLYLAAGIVCALLVNSTLITIASLLLILAGVAVLIMRYRFRSEQKRLRREVSDELHFAADHYDALVQANRERVLRSISDRRKQAVAAFPVEDKRGSVIAFDRRNGERRNAFA
jgi:archaellum biogenesis protein FlaJ (TadC family)